jgi:hypothetical protein
MEVEDENQKKITVPNPAYGAWIKRDQQVLRYLLQSLSPDVLSDVLDLEHAAEVWKTIGDIFSAQSQARIGMLRAALTNTKKRGLTASVYIAKMKGFASELTAAGRAISDIELKEYLLAGLGKEYNGLVASINANPATSSAGVCNQLMSYDYRDEILSESEPAPDIFTSLANAAARGRGSRPGQGGGYRSDNNYGGHNGGSYNGGGRNLHRGRPHVAKMAPVAIVVNRQKGAWPWPWPPHTLPTSRCHMPNLQEIWASSKRVLVALRRR